MAKTLLSIGYAPGLMKNPITGITKAYAHIVENGTVDIDYLCSSIAKATTLTRTDVKAAVESFIEFVMEYVASGFRVDMGNLGKFFPQISATGVEDVEDCTATTIKRVFCRFMPSQELQNIMATATFNRVLSRKNESKTISEESEELAAKLAALREP